MSPLRSSSIPRRPKRRPSGFGVSADSPVDLSFPDEDKGELVGVEQVASWDEVVHHRSRRIAHDFLGAVAYAASPLPPAPGGGYRTASQLIRRRMPIPGHAIAKLFETQANAGRPPMSSGKTETTIVALANEAK